MMGRRGRAWEKKRGRRGVRRGRGKEKGGIERGRLGTGWKHNAELYGLPHSKHKINYANSWPPPFGKIVQRAIGKELYYTLCKGPGAIAHAGK